MPEGIVVGLVEGVAGFEVGVAVEVVFEGFPGGFAVGVEEFCDFRSVSEVMMEGVPVFEWCRFIDFGFVGVLFGGVGGWVGVGEHGGFNSMFSVRVLCSSDTGGYLSGEGSRISSVMEGVLYLVSFEGLFVLSNIDEGDESSDDAYDDEDGSES